MTVTEPQPSERISTSEFRDAYARFERLIVAHSPGHPFTTFDEGIAGAEEGYKLPLRKKALALLQPDTWREDDVGGGSILARTIAAIEIQDSRGPLTNNLVFWQNRFGPQNQDHRGLIDAQDHPASRLAAETLLYGLYRGIATKAECSRGSTG